MNKVWAEAAGCFDTDDGSLPGIEITSMTPSGVSAVYGMLRHRSHLIGDPPEFWSRTANVSVLVDSVPNAAGMVASGEAEAFHHCVGGITAGGVELPVLGIFVWQNGVELDYRMGLDWTADAVIGFFELLRECCLLDAGATILPAELEGPPYPDRFLRAWSLYNEQSKTEE